MFGGDVEGAFDGPFLGAAVADNADAVHAQKRGAAQLVIVVAFDDVLQRELRQRHFGLERAEDFLGDDFHDEVEDPFTDFQDDIADESLGDDDLADSLVDIAAFNVADELVLERAVAEEVLRFLGELVALSSSEPMLSRPIFGLSRWRICLAKMLPMTPYW